jgi:hypothetical protein
MEKVERPWKKMAQADRVNPDDFPLPKPLMISSISVLPPYRQESFLRQKYEVEGLSIRQISAQIFSAREVIAKHMREYGIPLRSYDESLAMNKGQIAYGERQTNEGIIYHKKQNEVIALMLRLRAKKYSYWKIAKELTDRGIPTKNGNSHWKPATVMKICKRASLQLR